MPRWTEDRVTALHEQVAAGGTVRTIAQALGTTRNAIIGKVHRLGLTFAKQDDGIGPAERREKRLQYHRDRHRAQRLLRGLTYKPKPAAPTPLPQPKPIGALDLLDLGHAQCHWPVTDDAPYFFCGNQTVTGDYCPYHSRLALDPNQGRRGNRQWVF